MLTADDYWLADGQFHYTVKYGGENVIALDQVDVQKSTDENLKRGVKFTLKTRPAMASTGAAPVATKPAAPSMAKPSTPAPAMRPLYRSPVAA
jgi:hypothetical protein